MRVIDLFSGAGGLTFGFYYRIKSNRFVRNRKNVIIFANEYDFHASKAYTKNFPDIVMLNQDVRSLSSEQIRAFIGNEPIDLIIGGPPCQAYSTIGQRIFDERAVLYQEYLRILNIVRPKMFLFENVKGILSMREVFYKKSSDGGVEYQYTQNKETGRRRKKPIVEGYGRRIIDIIEEAFSNIDQNLGYTIKKEVLNSVDYGVPENRERVFIIGIRNDLHIDWEWPSKTKSLPLSVKDAISDLPPVKEGQEIVKYTLAPCNDYQRLMRYNSESLTQHYCGIYGKKIRTVIKNVKQGQGKEDFNRLVNNGIVSKEFELTSGYPNTYGRLVEDQPCPTITNNLSTPSSLRCIHYNQDRALTPREGARIQSFPDWFQFDGFKENVTTQIGNAVPPIMAIALCKKIESILKRGERNGNE